MVAIDADGPGARDRSPIGVARAWLRDPVRTFLLAGILAGVAIAVSAPAFTGIDEPAHFTRTLRIAEGNLLPDSPPPGEAGDGNCLPRTQLREMSALMLSFFGAPRPDDATLDERFPDCGEPGDERGFYATTSFAWYSPAGYAPQAVAAFVGRLVGLPLGAQLVLARLATLTTYLALVALAIKRAPAGRWALTAVALLPVSLFMAATSVSPDAVTTALVFVVVASAWRACAHPEVVGTRAFLVESILASVALGLAKPTYVLFAAAYLIPLVRERRWASWTLALPAAIGGGLSMLWYTSQRPRFACDVVLFGILPDPDRQLDQIRHSPLSFVGAGVRGLVDHGGGWLGRTFGIGEQVNAWTGAPVAVALAVALFVAVGAARAPGERFRPPVAARLALVALAAVGYLAVLFGWLVYCAAPELTLTNPPHPRLLLPLLPALALAAAPTGRLATRLARLPVPLGLAVVVYGLVFALTIGVTLR